jgi:threonine/homoserine/homoserine lactone efflux protein
MSTATLVAFIALELILCFIPGPAVLSVLAAALGRGPRAGFGTALGILTGNFFYFVLSAAGVASIVVASHAAFFAIKWCGAAYLGYLGLRALVRREEMAAVPYAQAARLRRAWVNGTVVQVSNPKALVFFTAILPQFVDPRGNVPMQLAILGAAGLGVELAVLSVYIALADRVRSRGLGGPSQRWGQRLGGVFLLAVAVAVARESL